MSGDLRAAVERLHTEAATGIGSANYRVPVVNKADLLALIPEGAVLVTEATLAAAIVVVGGYAGHPMTEAWREGSAGEVSAAILRHLREGT